MQYNLMGGIVGDIVGSKFEWKSYKDISNSFRFVSKKSRYTDDTVLTVALADAVIHDGDYQRFLKSYTKKDPNRGYGKMYKAWALNGKSNPNGSYANGGAMRLSSIPLYFRDLYKIQIETIRSTAITHNHPESLDASMLLSTAIFLSRITKDKEYIRILLEHNFQYKFGEFVDDSKESKYVVKDSLKAKAAVSFSLDCFFSSYDYESAIRTAVCSGGDTDTIASIVGAIAFTFYGEMKQELHDKCWIMLPSRYRQIIKRFHKLSTGKKPYFKEYN